MNSTAFAGNIWWISRRPNTLLRNFAYAMLPKGWRVILSAKGTGVADFRAKTVQANPELFSELPVKAKFLATQGILAHEVGHVWWTDDWVEKNASPALQWLANALEDERMERALIGKWPRLGECVWYVGNQIYQETSIDGSERLSPGHFALACSLSWRWAHRFADEDDLFRRYDAKPNQIDAWRKVQPLVEQAWVAPSTTDVINIAKEILVILKMPRTATPPQMWGDYFPSGIFQKCRPTAAHSPLKAAPPAENDSDDKDDLIAEGETEMEHIDDDRIIVLALREDDVNVAHRYTAGDDITSPGDFVPTEMAAKPITDYLKLNLRLPTTKTEKSPNQFHGRYHYRQAVRHPDTPYRKRDEPGHIPTQSVFILVDRSGSMRRFDETIQTVLMGAYNGAMHSSVSLPLGIGYFGASSGAEENPKDFTFLVSPVTTIPSDISRAYIAGYAGKTGAEFMFWGLEMAEAELMKRDVQGKRSIIVIHDGHPVYNGPLGSDWELSRKKIAELNRLGFIVTGLYLGQEDDDIGEDVVNLRQLFNDSLVVCDQSTFGRKFVTLLKNARS